MPRRRIIKKNINNLNITFATCYYNFKNKFNNQTYINWIKNFLPFVNNFKLVVFCDHNSLEMIKEISNNNPNIKIIIKNFEDFYLYKYKDFFIENHKKNNLLNDKVDWRVNLLWCQKCFFVKEVIEQKYFTSDYYGWCDIGYFRNTTSESWPEKNSLEDKIYYNSIGNYKKIRKINGTIDPSQQSICGGFFIAREEKSLWWANRFEEKLKHYIDNNLLVKDDQTLIVDCLQEEDNNFKILLSNDWFYFIKYLK